MNIISKIHQKIKPVCQIISGGVFTKQHTLLTIHEFIEMMEFDIDGHMVDMCFINLRDDMPVYIDTNMIEWMGYKGTIKTQKQLLSELLERNFKKDIDYNVYNNKEYTEWLNTDVSNGVITYPEPYQGAAARRGKHLIMPSSTFKKVLMMLNTSKAGRIREYYINMEKLLRMYILYQCGNLNIPINKKYTRHCAIMELEIKIQKKYRFGCVYFIQEEDTGNIKIGWCWNLRERLHDLQVCNSRLLTVIKYKLTQFPYDSEQYLHAMYIDYHIRGEWYKSDVIDKN
jgi:hypothetical protein